MFGPAQPSGSYLAAVVSYMPSPSSLAIIALVAILAYFVASTFFHGRYTVPLPSYKSGFVGSMEEKEVEGFTVPERSFLPPPPDCYTEDETRIVSVFNGRKSTTEEGGRDLVEFKHLLNKMSCFKKDLVSPKYTINATLKQPFITTHDIEPISETTGRCFAKTIPPRDLDLAMDKWTERGSFLILRLCTSFSLNDAEAGQMETNFQSFLRDVYDTAREKCLQKEPHDASRGPRDPSPFSVGTDVQIGEFNGYY
jgi:hypothetical protein